MALTLVLALVLIAMLGAKVLQAQGLTEEARARIAEDRSEFLEAASTAIAWFGDARGLNLAAIDDYLAAERAERRASVMQGLLMADLSGDGQVSAAEVARIAPSLTVSARGKLFARHDLGDENGDGTVSDAELVEFARAEALRLVPAKGGEDLRLLLLFDADGDGWVTYDGVKAGIADIAA